MPAKDTLSHRLNAIKARLGLLAYERRGHEISVEKIDGQVAQMEAQQVLIEATLDDIRDDERIEQKEREDERQKRSARSKAAAKKRKREKAEKKSRESESSSST